MIPFTPSQYYNILGNNISTEALAMNIAFVFLFIYLFSGLARRKFDKDLTSPKGYAFFIFVLAMASLAGGRLWYFISYWKGPQTILLFFDIRKGGLISMGMIAGAVFGLLIYLLVRYRGRKDVQRKFLVFVDVLVPSTALAIFVYRLFGCTVYGLCTKGVETAVPWGLYWVSEGVVRHPVPAYLALSGLFIFLFLRIFFSTEKRKGSWIGLRFPGEAGIWFLLLFCLNRFFIEFLRTDRAAHWGLHTVQWACLFGMLFMVHELVKYYYLRKRLKMEDPKKFNHFITKYSWFRQFAIFYRLVLRKGVR